jgi:hypothetical protein
MKNFIFVLLTVLMLMAEPASAGWFDNEEEQRLREVAQELQEQRQATGSWQIVAGMFAVGAVILFTVGTALGSKVRRSIRKEEAL